MKELLRVEILDSDGCHDLVSLLLDGFLESELTSVASVGLYEKSSIYVRLFMLLFTGDSNLRSYLINPESGCGDILKSAFMKAINTLATHKEDEKDYQTALNQLKLVSSVYMQCCAEDSSGFMKLFVGDEDCQFLKKKKKKEEKQKEVRKEEGEQRKKEEESSEAKEEDRKEEKEEERAQAEVPASDLESETKKAEEETKEESAEKVDEPAEETKEPEEKADKPKEDKENENENEHKRENENEHEEELKLNLEPQFQEQPTNTDALPSPSPNPIGRRLWCVLCDIVLGDYLSIELNVFFVSTRFLFRLISHISS